LRAHALVEREHYNATIGFLSCAKYEDSPVHALPKELREIIARLAKEGFEFKKPESVKNPSRRSVRKAKAKPSKKSISSKNDLLFFSRRYLPEKIFAGACMAFIAKLGHNCWKRWRKLKKRAKKKQDVVESVRLFDTFTPNH